MFFVYLSSIIVNAFTVCMILQHHCIWFTFTYKSAITVDAMSAIDISASVHCIPTNRFILVSDITFTVDHTNNVITADVIVTYLSWSVSFVAILIVISAGMSESFNRVIITSQIFRINVNSHAWTVNVITLNWLRVHIRLNHGIVYRVYVGVLGR